MVSRCRLLAAHGLTSCLSVGTQPLTATGAPSQTSTIPYHTITATGAPSQTSTYHTIPVQGTFGTYHTYHTYHTWHNDILPSTSMVDSVTGLRYAECSRAPDYVTKIGFLGRWGTYACPQCLPRDIVPIRSWTRTLRPPGIRHRHPPYHTIPYQATVHHHTSSVHRSSVHHFVQFVLFCTCRRSRWVCVGVSVQFSSVQFSSAVRGPSMGGAVIRGWVP